MTSMTTDALRLPSGPLTVADLESTPDDGRRYELLDGVLIVSPAPRFRHQEMAANLFSVLRAQALADASCSELVVLFAPFDVTLADDTVMQPDLLVAPRSAFTEKALPTAPLLAVEVLSPSTRGVDLLLKRERLERAGCAHYWVVDPDEPSIIAWSLVDGTYTEVARATGAERFSVTEPLAVEFVPDTLLG